MVASVAVLSDVHGMLYPLNRVLAEPVIAKVDLLVVTGDHTWGPQPVEVLDRLLELGDRVLLVRGNADRELLHMSRGLDVGLNDDELSVWGAQQLRANHQHLLEGMPESAIVDIDGFGPVFFSHATPRSDEEIVLVDSTMDRWQEVLDDLPVAMQTVVLGHTHMPFVRLVNRRLVVNPGSVGLPYGRAGAHWAVLDRGLISLGRTLFDMDALVHETQTRSSFPGVHEWLTDTVHSPASDTEAVAEFRERDGRNSER